MLLSSFRFLLIQTRNSLRLITMFIIRRGGRFESDRVHFSNNFILRSKKCRISCIFWIIYFPYLGCPEEVDSLGASFSSSMISLFMVSRSLLSLGVYLTPSFMNIKARE